MRNLTKYSIMLATLCLMSANANAQHPNVEKVNATFVEGTKSRPEKESAAMVADGYLHTKWCIDDASHMPYYAVLDAQSKVAVKAYALATGDDTNWYPGRNPMTWNVYGSDDKKNWQLIDAVKRDQKMADENEQFYYYHVKEASAFRYYKFEFVKMWAGTRLQLSEIRLFK